MQCCTLTKTASRQAAASSRTYVPIAPSPRRGAATVAVGTRRLSLRQLPLAAADDNADAAAAAAAPRPPLADLICQTRAWRRLEEIARARHLKRADVLSLVASPPLAGVLEALMHPQVGAALEADPALRSTLEAAVEGFDATLSEHDLGWLADLADHVNRQGAGAESVDAATWEAALQGFGRAPSPGAARLLAAVRAFWTQERVDSFLAGANITPASADAVRAMIADLHAQPARRHAALATMDVLELALPPAEIWALANAAPEGPPLDWHDFMDEDFLDQMRHKVAPC